ncbi:hypothetical protein E3N88_39907 [Mikania micrantha]|uniref:Uncharacterized protein n=1 Tax=Mikania micrantha TaxID=192012 RepID=A0A5N6LL44_9ASTR|nr:hypothetical protein E3N88_39907 [Mikania micrantha]
MTLGSAKGELAMEVRGYAMVREFQEGSAGVEERFGESCCDHGFVQHASSARVCGYQRYGRYACFLGKLFFFLVKESFIVGWCFGRSLERFRSVSEMVFGKGCDEEGCVEEGFIGEGGRWL